ncbi:SAM-dependent methyltransferase [Herbidospora sp. NEAU-GS84]|uniref:SAM-dependent methyltransferase n=1 Tax=Herbidospora solisilvae TaxID=2696284 RepID=A0A7C9NEZ4_9ACTN|nr:SAM-dependent methyltransferase [Herbidospora solisilvae]NAS20612.1 SAM-dependent methyltransferase [Herbidospora solisilvae]
MADEYTNPRADYAARLNTSTPHAARIWNYWMGGKDNYAADRQAGDAVAAVYPDIVTMAKQSRKFLIRAVRWVAEEGGVKQFLDIGTGLPTMQNTHEVAQSVHPDARIVYVDNDPMVLVHARALLVNTTPQGVTTYVEADYHDPELIVADAKNVLDFTKPICVMFMGVLGYVEKLDELKSIVDRVMAHVPSGSYMIFWDSSEGDEIGDGADKLVESGGVPYYLRSVEELKSVFDGLEFVEPGLVPLSQWHPTEYERPIDSFGGVARKP